MRNNFSGANNETSLPVVRDFAATASLYMLGWSLTCLTLRAGLYLGAFQTSVAGSLTSATGLSIFGTLVAAAIPYMVFAGGVGALGLAAYLVIKNKKFDFLSIACASIGALLAFGGLNGIAPEWIINAKPWLAVTLGTLLTVKQGIGFYRSKTFLEHSFSGVGAMGAAAMAVFGGLSLYHSYTHVPHQPTHDPYQPPPDNGAGLKHMANIIGYDPEGNPVKARVSSNYGWRTDPFTGEQQHHNGVDIAIPEGTSLASAIDGKVTFVGYIKGYGLTVEVTSPDGLKIRYAHLLATDLKIGQNLNMGQNVGYSGGNPDNSSATIAEVKQSRGSSYDKARFITSDDPGRANGSCVHVEIFLKNGQRVDPMSVPEFRKMIYGIPGEERVTGSPSIPVEQKIKANDSMRPAV